MASSDHSNAFGSVAHFAGLSEEDFDAYEKKKWRSNAYTLARRNAKDKLIALMRELQSALGPEALSGLELWASSEAPSVQNGREVKAQWGFFIREASLRAPLKPLLNKTDLAAGAGLFDIAIEHQHAAVFLRLDLDGLGVGVELPGKASVDRENLKKKLEYEGAVEPLLSACAALPAACQVGFGGETLPAADLTEAQLDAWAAAFEQDKSSLSFERSFSRSDPALGDPGFAAQLAELLSAFLPVLRFIAWAPDNDFVHVKFTVKQQAEQRAKEKVEAAPPALSAGARVQILGGLFAGRAGYLSELDRDKAKVMVGPVAVTVALDEIRPA